MRVGGGAIEGEAQGEEEGEEDGEEATGEAILSSAADLANLTKFMTLPFNSATSASFPAGGSPALTCLLVAWAKFMASEKKKKLGSK